MGSIVLSSSLIEVSKEASNEGHQARSKQGRDSSSNFERRE